MLTQQVRKLQGAVAGKEYRLRVALYGEAVGYRITFESVLRNLVFAV